MNEKGELVVREIDKGRSPISLVLINAGFVPTLESYNDIGIVPIPESHVNVGIVPIPKSCVETGTVRVHVSMLTGVQTPRRAMTPQCCYGCYEPCLTQCYSVSILRRH